MKKVYILHGWTYNLEKSDPKGKWKPFLDSLEKKGITAQFLKIPVLTIESDRSFDLDDYIDWLHEEVKKVGGKVVLVGHSNGGRISLAFANKYPELVDQIVLIDSAGIVHNELSLKLKRWVFRNLAQIGKKLTTSENLRKLLYKFARERDYADATPIQKQTMINLIKHDLTTILPNIKAPTLIIWGESDQVTPLADGKKMHKLIKGSKLKVISGARHSPQFTHTEEVVEEIVKELSNLSSRLRRDL